MKKIIAVLILLLAPVFVSASIDANLYYGLKNNEKVKELQQYLIDKGFLTSKATGNYYSLTYAAVKNYQTSKGIKSTGYVGPLTRQAINADLASATTSTTTTTTNTTTTTTTTETTTQQTQSTGTFDLSKNITYTDQSIIAPQPNFKLADFVLTNNTAEPINLNTIEVDLSIGSGSAISLYITNLYVDYGGNKTAIKEVIAEKNYWTINSQIPAGKTINLYVYANVDSSIPLNSTVTSGLLVKGTTANSNTAINTNSGNILAGQNSLFGASSLTATLDSQTPETRIVVANQTVVAGKFRFETSKDSFTLSELKFILPRSYGTSIISGAILLDTATQAVLTEKPIVVIDNGSNYFLDFSNLNIALPINNSKTITVSYTLSSYVSQLNANKNIAPTLVYVKAKNSKGGLVDGIATDYSNSITALYGGITLPAAGVSANNLYVFKSLPTLSADSFNTTASNNSDANLYTFSISADKSGEIFVKQIMFTINITDPSQSYPHFVNFKVIKGSVDYTGSVSVGTIVSNNYVDLTGDNGIGIGTNTVVLTFNKEETIAAGTTQTYTLKARAHNFVTSSTLGSDSVSTYVSSDNTATDGGKYLRMAFTKIYGLAESNSDVPLASYNFLWSDKSSSAFSIHSDLNGSSTPDWYSGFKVFNLPIPSQTVTAK